MPPTVTSARRWWWETEHGYQRVVWISDGLELNNTIVVTNIPAWIDWLETDRRIHDRVASDRKKHPRPNRAQGVLAL